MDATLPALDSDRGRTRGERFVGLDQERLQSALDRYRNDAGVPVDWDVRVVASTSSTNSDLLREARSGKSFTRPAVLATELQTAGRGRLGRSWHSSPGASLTVSYAFCIARRLGELEGVTLACGLALRDVVASHGVRAELKWPNDVLVAGRKLAGILVEAHGLPNAAIVVVGVGINVRPPSMDAAARSDAQSRAGSHADSHVGRGARVLPAVDLHTAGSAREDRNQLAAEIAFALDRHLARFAAGGFAEFAADWNAADAFRNRRVLLTAAALPAGWSTAGSSAAGSGTAPGDSVSGFERGVDAGGGLLIEIDGVTRRFIAGDLSLRAIDED